MRTLIFAICLCIGSTHSIATEDTLQSAAKKATQAVELARKGEYGRLSSVQINMLVEARNRLTQLAKENASVDDFDSGEQRILDHALERINRLTRSTNKERLVCKKVVKTGTRFVTNECLTVAQREERAKSSRDRTEQIQRAICNNAQCG
jgi:hypothetical protein